MIALVLACRPEPPGPRPDPIGLVAEPVLSDGIDTPLSHRLTFETEVPTRLVLELSSDDDAGFDVTFPGFATVHDVPVLGLEADAVWQIVIRIEDGDGRTTRLPALTVHTPPLPLAFPVIEGLAWSDRSVGGYWLVPIQNPGDNGFWLAMIDPTDARVAWLYDGPINWGDVRMTPQGTLLGLAGGAVEMDLFGHQLRSWRHGATDDPDAVPIPWPLNHELFPMPDGSFLSIVNTLVDVPAYPESYDDPTPVGPATLVDGRVVRFGADGTVRSSWPLAPRLDTTRIGFDSLNDTGAGFDWVHANAVIADGDGVIVSVRHQDCLVRLDADGAVDWILGDPAGWSSRFADRLLRPEPGTIWPYHMHGPERDDDGLLWVFDNRTVEATPYAALPPDPGPSRIVAYAIDAGARTVSQVVEWRPPVELRSSALGNVRHLAGSDRVLASFGMLRAEGEVRNEDIGRGANHTRIMEIDPAEAEPVADVRIWTDPTLAPQGTNVYRVAPVASLYPPEVTVRRR